MSGPLRLMLWHWGRRGGGPRYTLELAQVLKDLPGVELHLSISHQCEIADEFRTLDLPTFWVDTYTDIPTCLVRSAGLPQIAWRMRRYVREQQIEVVNSTMAHLWTRLIAPVLRQAGVSLLCTIHDATLHPGEDGPIKSWFYAPARCDGYIALTSFVANRLTEIHGIARSRITVVPHGVVNFTRAEPPSPTRSGGPLRLLFFGRILPYKGLANLLTAYRMLRADGYNFTLHIAGTGELGPMAEIIADLPDVTLDRRWIPEESIPALLSEADTVVLPYLESSQSGVIPAAFGMGIPAVVTPVGGLTEQVAADVNGLVTTDTSPQSLALALKRLMDEPQLVGRLRAGAIKAARNELDWARIGHTVVQLSVACRPRSSL